MGDWDQDAKKVATNAGATFSIHLWEDRTRGELWVPSYDPTGLALVDEEFLRTVSNNAVDSGRRSLNFARCTQALSDCSSKNVWGGSLRLKTAVCF